MRTHLAKLAGKLISHTTRALKLGGGSAAPGLYALKIDPELVTKLSKEIPKNIIITGTNGKTTTARLLSHFLRSAGYKVINNSTGSNLERGIASALIHNSSFITRNSEFDFGVWELDEGAFNSVAPKLDPDIAVLLNVSRDQLDRYGEVNTILKKWSETLKKMSKDTLILANGDDANTSRMEAANLYRFGLKDHKITGEVAKTQKVATKLDLEAKDVKLNGLESVSFSLILHGKTFPITLPIPGVYNVYNFLAAFYAGHELGLSTESMIDSLKGFQSAFGRVEKLPFGYIFLTKNPSGADQVFQTITPQVKPEDRLLLALNDNLADSTDVSWIWDTDFEAFYRGLTSGKVDSDAREVRPLLYASGTRAYDLALRLKYAGFDAKQLLIDPNLKKALEEARSGLKGQLYILPTYTAMLELQGILVDTGVKSHYWREV